MSFPSRLSDLPTLTWDSVPGWIIPRVVTICAGRPAGSHAGTISDGGPECFFEARRIVRRLEGFTPHRDRLPRLQAASRRCDLWQEEIAYISSDSATARDSCKHGMISGSPPMWHRMRLSSVWPVALAGELVLEKVEHVNALCAEERFQNIVAAQLCVEKLCRDTV